MECDISIVIPVYNNEKTILETLKSCINQSCQPKEIVIIDDASMDDTADMIQNWKREYRGEIKLIYHRLETNRGPSFARNFGWNLSSGKYISFLDADDRFEPDKLETIAGIFEENADIILLAHNHRIDDKPEAENRIGISKVSVRALLIKNRFATSSVTLLRSIPERFDETMRYTEDHDLWLRVTGRYEKSFYVEKKLTVIGRRINSQGGQSGSLWKMRKGEMKMYRKYCRYGRKPLLFPLILFSLGKHTIKILKRRT